MAGNAQQMIRDAKGRFWKSVKDPTLIRKATHLALSLMRRRWRKGIDRHGRQMAPYAPSTRDKKRRQGKPTAPANLIDTGATIASLDVRPANATKAYSTRAEIYVKSSRARKLIRLHTRGAGRLPVRDPLGLTRREQQIVSRRYGADVARRIPRADRRKAIKMYVRM